jgi:hypothetical protein
MQSIAEWLEQNLPFHLEDAKSFFYHNLCFEMYVELSLF